MQLATHSDADLVRLAQQGAESAFAVLVYRYAPAVRACVATHPEPVDAVVNTFLRAMRQQSDRDPDDPVAPWLMDLATRQVDDPAPVAVDDAPPMDPSELDEVWAALAPRWPNGRRPRYVPRWVWRTLAALAILTVLLALAVLVPYVAITTAAEEREPTERVIDEVVAEPYAEPVDRESASELYTPHGGSDGGPSLDFDIDDRGDRQEPSDADPNGDADPTADTDATGGDPGTGDGDDA